MRVLMVNNLYAPNVRGGAERSVQLLAEALAVAGVEVTVVSADERSGAPVELNGVKVVTLGVPNVYWPFGDAQPSPSQRKLWHLLDIYNPLAKRSLLQVVRDERPEVVHTHNLQGLSVAAWWAAEAAGVPVLHSLRDYYLACARAMCFRDGRNCTRTCMTCLPFCTARRALSQSVAGVVGTSRFILDRHLELGFFRGASSRRAIGNVCGERPERREVGRAPLTFGYLGRLEPMKGVELLLGAFAERADSRWRLLIAGAGPAAVVDTWKRQAAGAKQPDQIRFFGWTDWLELLARIDVLIVPSLWHEPLSRSAIEAQSSGVPVIASRRGGLPEIVEDEATGLLFEPDEVGSLARAIDRMLDDPRLVSRLGAGALELSQRFRPEVIAAQYLEAYEDVRSLK